jgi:exodeoxyribonuclease VII small subunit
MDDETPIPSAGDVNNATDPLDLTYEQARDELISIVAQLEGGQIPLEDSMALWQRGEALATHCNRWLDGAEAKLKTVSQAQEGERD